jgi:Tol biopolymer transport system component
MTAWRGLLGVVAAFLLISSMPLGSAQGEEGNAEKVLSAGRNAGQKSSNIFQMNPDGSGKVNLTKTKEFEMDPVWSPDRKRIAFAVLDRAQIRSDIYVMDADGSKRTQLTKHAAKTKAHAPSWSPDGKRIAFSVMPDGDFAKTSLYVMDADGKNLKRLGEGTGMLPVWSPDGKKILYTFFEKVERKYPYSKSRFDNPRLYVMDADGKNAKALTKGKTQSGAYSPDGKRIAFLGIISGDTVLGVMNADGSEPRALLKEWGEVGPNAVVGPKWSADGKRIFFNRVFISREDDLVAAVIFVMDADGKNVKALTGDKDVSVLGGNEYLVGLAVHRWSMSHGL